MGTEALVSSAKPTSLRLAVFDASQPGNLWPRFGELDTPWEPQSLKKGWKAYKQRNRNWLLHRSWMLGSYGFRALGRFDAVYPAQTWEDALRWLTKVGEHEGIAEVQYWGHGAPGRAYCNQEYLFPRSAQTSDHTLLLAALASLVTEESLLWFRICSLFTGKPGQSFARTWADDLGCQIAGHTFIIGFPFHSGAYVLRPGEVPSWSELEGVKSGTADQPREIYWSRRAYPNTIWTWQTRPPTSILVS